MTATAVASCPCIPDEVFCAWSGWGNKLNSIVQCTNELTFFNWRNLSSTENFCSLL